MQRLRSFNWALPRQARQGLARGPLAPCPAAAVHLHLRHHLHLQAAPATPPSSPQPLLTTASLSSPLSRPLSRSSSSTAHSFPNLINTRRQLHTQNKAAAMDPETLKHFLADSPPTVVPLAIKPHFDALTDKEKLYAHWISIACFAGSRIVLRQVSPSSEPIFDLIIALHKHSNGDWSRLAQQAGLSDDDVREFLNYAAQFLGNLGNYKSFGDVKFVPRIEAAKIKALAGVSPETAALYERIEQAADGGVGPTAKVEGMHLGYPSDGHLSTYYPDSPDITKEEIDGVSNFLEAKGFLPENTRVRKTSGGDFEVLIASAQTEVGEAERDVKETEWVLQEGGLKGKKLRLVYGDYKEEMKKVADALEQAAKYAANDTQKKMLEEYVKSFRTGSLLAFKESQRYWIRDKGPSVEADIGFIETYRDPHGIRGEWEGFVAMVNKERTRAFGKLVEAAPKLIPRLPWDKEFEKDNFLSPDFTSLEVLTFAGSGIPAGINIPNYDDIRQTEGFKNVSLGNVLSAKAPNEPIPFIKASDDELYRRCRDDAFEVQVGLHELLGHGCGKLLQETSPGQFNFDINNPPISPLTGKPITSWYKPGQTWGSVFGPMAGSYEECRAECVAMYLACSFDILHIFGFGDGTEDLHGPAGDILYAAYLSMARAGVAALEFWDPTARRWGQAHMQARFSILRCFLDGAGPDFASLDYTQPDLSDLTVRVDRARILDLGRPAVGRYLQQLHVLKATADLPAATALYERLTHVDAFFEHRVRPAVLRRKTPRKVFVQPNTVLVGEGGAGDVVPVVREYEPTPEGMVRSWVERGYV